MNTEKIIDEITALVTQVEEGNFSALNAYSKFKKVSKILEAATEQIKKSALEEAATYGEKKFSAFGLSFELRNGGAQYDYKHIPEWAALKEKMTAIEKTAQNKASNPNILMASEGGEEIIAAKISFKSDSIIVE